MKALNHLQLTLRQYLLMMALMSPLAVIAIPCNTGLDGAASTCGISLLGAGSSDEHWSVADPYPTAPTGPLIDSSLLPTLSFGSAFANRNAAWSLVNGPNSGWITPTATLQSLNGGQYVYHTTFTGATPFEGQYSSDNILWGVFLNNAELVDFPHNIGAEFFKWTPFSISAGLNTGLNTLDFVVRNYGGGGIDSNPTGFRAKFSAISEPSIVGLFLMGLPGFMFFGHRYTKHDKPHSVTR